VQLETGIIIAAVPVIAAAAFFLVRSAKDKVTDDLVSRASRFPTPDRRSQVGWLYGRIRNEHRGHMPAAASRRRPHDCLQSTGVFR
jgi:hypothetical protein